jgi:predicted DNA binding protein
MYYPFLEIFDISSDFVANNKYFVKPQEMVVIPVIQLEFSANAENWIVSLCRDKLAKIKVLSLRALDAGAQHVMHFVDISSDNYSAEDLTQDLKNASDITESDLARVGPKRVIGSITSNHCLVCRALLESNANCFIAPATSIENCDMSYKLYLSGGGLPIFLTKLHENGVRYKIDDLSPLSSVKGMTARQQSVLKSALELGYYDFPKRISTDKLAEKLGIKAGTVSEILRRAEKNVISRYFEEGES